MQLIQKILFLHKSNSSFIIFYKFLITKLKNIYFKKQIKVQKKKHVEFLKKKILTHDYFSSHAFNFNEILKSYKKFEYLEIGSFEGNSSMFVAKNFPEAKIYCVDNWVGTKEYENLEFSNIEKNFDQNMSEFNNYYKFKKTSDDFFKDNNKKFDAIYIDGYHNGSQVYKDFQNSWRVLNDNGVIIFDDYIWNFYKNLKDNPCYMINLYLKEIKNKVKILKVSNSQLFIKKIC